MRSFAVAQSKILVDTNAYFRLAQSIRPLLKTEFGEPPYCLYVIKELQDEYNKSPRLLNKFPWVNDPEYRDNRSHRVQFSKLERSEIEQAFDFIFDHKRTAYPTVSRVDVTVLAHAYVLGLPVVTDDTDMLALAKEFGITTLKTLDLLKLMLDSSHIDTTKVREIAGFLSYQNDRPKEFKADYKRLFKEDIPV
jgi:predicted nuclease of predicted toxin-antitoxin system